MKYKYTQNDNYGDFASGKVLYSIPGASAFPIRLINEIFLLCYDKLKTKDKVTIFDPCCGSAYHLTALGFLNPDKIKKIICSDINPDILKSAEKNLSLLTESGLNRRILEINEMISNYSKDSHKEALESALKFQNLIEGHKIETLCFQDDMLKYDAFQKIMDENIDVVFADTPYSNLEHWQGNIADDNIFLLLENILQVTNPGVLVAVATDKKQKVEHEEYERIRKIIAGKRMISILKMKI
jgi:16S rRNA G966 N2-methylase RsmD